MCARKNTFIIGSVIDTCKRLTQEHCTSDPVRITNGTLAVEFTMC